MILQSIHCGRIYGYSLMETTGLPSGTVYPALRRFEVAGLTRSKWEKDNIAEREQRPPRRYYELTKLGHSALAEAVKRYRTIEGMFAVPINPQASDV